MRIKPLALLSMVPTIDIDRLKKAENRGKSMEILFVTFEKGSID